MALTGLDIYKLLPKTNCGECGVPTCLAFAMKLAQKQTSLDQCPHVTDEAKQALEGAAAPPIKLVTIGAGDTKIELGNETVLFRHDETFYHPTAIAITLDASQPPDEQAKRIEAINGLSFERVGQTIGVNLIAVRSAGDAAGFAAAAKLASEKSRLALMLITEDPAEMQAALEAVADRKPLLCGATADNLEAMAALAKDKACPLVIRADGLENLPQLSEKAAAAGAADLVLDSGARTLTRGLAEQTAIRRAALKKKLRPLGFPTIAFPANEDPMTEALEATTYIAKYAGVVVLSGVEPWEHLPVLTARQNIYTDPQKPIQLEAGIYQVGTPDEDAPVMVTTNFSLTYFTVEGDVDASKVPAWMVVVDTEGTSVLTAWAAEKFTADSIAQAMKQFDIAAKVKHRKVIIPGHVAVLSGKLEEASGWEVLVGPRESSGIPTYLRTSWPKAA